MEILLVKPKNKEELDFLTDFFERANISSEVHEEVEVLYKKKVKKSRKEKILDSIEKSYREALLHSEGKLELKTAKELLDEL